MEKEDKIEKFLGSPGAAVAASFGAAGVGILFPPLAIVAPAFAFLLTAPAGIRRKKRVDAEFAEIAEHFQRNEEAIQNLTDGQHDFVVATLNTLQRSADERKMELLKFAIKNGLREPFEHYEAEVISRILRDISFEEARFLVERIRLGRIEIMAGEGESKIKRDGKERLIVAGLVSIGVLMQSDTIGIDVNSYDFSAIAPKVAKLLMA